MTLEEWICLGMKKIWLSCKLYRRFPQWLYITSCLLHALDAIPCLMFLTFSCWCEHIWPGQSPAAFFICERRELMSESSLNVMSERVNRNEFINHRAWALSCGDTEDACGYPGCVWALCHHEHEVQVDQVCAAADADDATLQVGLRLSNGLERRQDLRVLRK